MYILNIKIYNKLLQHIHVSLTPSLFYSRWLPHDSPQCMVLSTALITCYCLSTTGKAESFWLLRNLYTNRTGLIIGGNALAGLDKAF